MELLMGLFMVDLNDYLMPVYKTAYYGGAFVVCLGLSLILLRTKCLPSELWQRRYNHYFHDEISAFATYSCVLCLYLMNAFGLPLIQSVIDKITSFSAHSPHESAEMIDVKWAYFWSYCLKFINEVLLVVIIVYSHHRAQVKQSKFTKFVASVSLAYGAWHLLRGFDNIIFETNLMDSVYTPVGVLITLIVTLAMFVHAIKVTMMPHKEF